MPKSTDHPKKTSELSRNSRAALSFFVGGLAGSALLSINKYLEKIRNQGSLDSDQFFEHLDEYTPKQRQALIIAADNLVAGIEKRLLPDGKKKLVLNAGMRNFREPWARDFGFASYGLLSMNELEATKQTLEVFLEFQKADGQFPVKLHSTPVLVRALYSIFNRPQPITAPLKPKYISGHKSISTDGNPLLVSAAINYVQKSVDQDFLSKYWDQLKKAKQWLEGFAPDKDGLIYQGPYSDWADTVDRSGKVLYTNMVYWKALHDMAAAAEKYKFKDDFRYFSSRSNSLNNNIQEHFWSDKLGYYITSMDFPSLNTSGNLMAVAWGCASLKQSNSILDKMEEMGLADPVPTKPVSAPYPRKNISIEARLGGFPHYHIEAAWLWLGGWHIIALTQINRLAEASQLLDRLAEFINRDNTVHEVYERNGEYFSNLFYTSEAPLTWSAGMIIYAFQRYHRKLHENK